MKKDCPNTKIDRLSEDKLKKNTVNLRMNMMKAHLQFLEEFLKNPSKVIV